MAKRIKHRNVVIILLMIMITYGCQPDPLEYSRPKDLVGTIYTQLESLGGYTYYLKCLDKTPYAEPLSKGAAWTVFVPTDEAFEKFMKDEGYDSFDKIPTSRIQAMIEYTLLTGGYNSTALSYSPRFATGGGFRRTTQYRDSAVTVNAENYIGFENLIPDADYIVDMSSGRNKTLHVLTPQYIEHGDHPLEYTDYDFLYPERTKDNELGAIKVFEANMIEKDILAENGFIHVLDKVIEPRINIYQNIFSEEYVTDEYPDGKYSIFRSIVNRFGTFNDRGADDVVNESTGVLEKRYTITFNVGIDDNNFGFNMMDEVYPDIISNDSDFDAEAAPGVTVPTNKALEEYLQNSLLGSLYSSYDAMPVDVLAKFININIFAHYWSLTPSLQGNVFSETKDQVPYLTSDAVDVKFCSNALFVGVDKVYERTSFVTIVGPMLLDPDYSLMFKAVQGLGIESNLQSQGINFTVLGVRNDQFVEVEDPNNELRKVTITVDKATGVLSMLVTGDVDNTVNRLYVSTDANDSGYINATLQSIVNNQIIEAPITLGSKSYYQTRTGEYVYVGEGNKISGGGDIFNGTTVEVTEENQYINGYFYDMSSFIERPLHYVYGALVNNTTTDFSSFVNVMQGGGVFIETFKNPNDRLTAITASTRNYTLLAPTNAAVDQAVLDGVIPDPDPAYLDTLDELERAQATEKLKEFAQRHFIQDPIITDGKKEGVYRTLYVKEVVNLVSIYQEYDFEYNSSNSSLNIKDVETGDLITTTGEVTNLLSKKIVIHQIENYLK